MLNHLLISQLENLFGGTENVPSGCTALLEMISSSYNEFEADRKKLERTIDLHAEKLIELNLKLRRETEELSKAHYELKLLFENVNQVFFSIDLTKNKIVQMSPACERIYGYSSEEFYQNVNLLKEVVYGEDRFLLNEQETMLAQGKSFDKEYRIVTKVGQIRWVETKMTPSFNSSNEVIRLDGIVSDITSRKKSEKALIESEKHSRNLFNQSTIGLALVNMQGALIDVNEAYTKIIGYSAQEIKNLTYWEITPEKFHALEKEKLQELKDSGRYASYEKEYIHKSGHIVPVKMSGILLEKDGEKFILSSIEDITESKKVQNDLLNKNLELQKTNQELDKFVYSVSHDLRAPLTSMLGVIEIAGDDNKDPLMHEHLDMLNTGIRKLDGFIQDILDYSRNARSDIRKEAINFPEIVGEITSHLKYMSGHNRPVEIRTNFNCEECFISDKRRISIVLNNLIANAIRYQQLECEHPFVDISVCTGAAEAYIIIKDNGIGIKQEWQDKVFDMFFRVSENSVGSGLGLYIVKETIEKLRGIITMESTFGKGTTMVINIPNN